MPLRQRRNEFAGGRSAQSLPVGAEAFRDEETCVLTIRVRDVQVGLIAVTVESHEYDLL